MNRDTVHRLTEYHWPGSIRELRNLVERLVVLSERSGIFENDIDQLLPQAKRTIDTTVRSLFHKKERLEKERILQTLQSTYGNKSITAKELGITWATLYKKIK
jgi:sigma-54 dependent transcriptional regulator, acetoin dehydrogenase operon transcriptional activator AcoR